jgi:secreted trypsin-like serine protease
MFYALRTDLWIYQKGENPMKRKLFVLACLLSMTLLLVTPALAITFGEPDEGRHPNVGTMVPKVPIPGIPTICTGTLISPTVFLTAAHCIYGMKAMFGLNPTDVYVTFDSEVSGTPATYNVKSASIASSYWHDSADPHDLAVLILEGPVAGITPAELPTANLLDDMQASGALKDQQFVAVGYGTVRDDKTGSPPIVALDGVRRYTTGTYRALTKSWLKVSENPATGDGGVCWGDSGGPHFLVLNGEEILVSVTSWGDAACRAMEGSYRLDTESARSFLGEFVGLP